MDVRNLGCIHRNFWGSILKTIAERIAAEFGRERDDLTIVVVRQDKMEG
ncbi:MAG: hypothetical protein QMD03_04950 [Syntrophales bacterium]|nr:hypothetical protein [Syntrophales bacterium]